MEEIIMWIFLAIETALMIGMIWAIGGDGDKSYPAKGEDTFPPDF